MKKVIHISYDDSRSGAGIAAARLFAALKKSGGIDTHFFAVESGPHSSPLCGKLKKFQLRCQQSLLYRTDRFLNGARKCAGIFNFFDNSLTDKILSLKPDIIHLHSITGEMLSIREIGFLMKNFPVVWTLHDTWPFCGCEQYFSDKKYISGYTSCNWHDFNAFAYDQKLHFWQTGNLHLIAPSSWMAKCASASKLMKKCPIHIIGNTLDSNIFRPERKENIRRKLGLPPKCKIIAAGATDIASPLKRHNLDILLDAVKQNVPDAVLLTAGKNKVKTALPSFHTGFIQSEIQMAEFYQAADVFLLPSLIDNLPNMALESVFCGTPVAANDCGGVSDIVGRDTGFISKDPTELAAAVCRHLHDTTLFDRERCREYAVSNFSEKNIVQKHLDVYEKL